LHDVLHVWDAAKERTQVAMDSQELFMQFRHALRADISPQNVPGPFSVESIGMMPGLHRVTVISDLHSNQDASVGQMLFYVVPDTSDGTKL
jgi:hypothetical protein